MKIRPARLADLATLVEFNRAMALETEGLRLNARTLRAGLRAVLADASKGFYLVAISEARVVGQLMVTFEWSDWRNAMWWWLQSVYVAPDDRQRGVFRRLYAEVRRRMRREGVHGLRLYVEQHNRRAQSTYEALGMKRGKYLLFETAGE